MAALVVSFGDAVLPHPRGEYDEMNDFVPFGDDTIISHLTAKKLRKLCSFRNYIINRAKELGRLPTIEECQKRAQSGRPRKY